MNLKKHLTVYKGLPKEIYILVASTVINKAGSFIMPLMSLILVAKMGFSKSEVGLFASIAMLTQVPCFLLGGTLTDKVGSKKIIVVLHIMGAMIYLWCSFMKPGLMVAILMIIASDIFSMAAPAFNAVVPIITPSPLIKKAYSFMYLGNNLGLVIGPAIGGLLFNKYLNVMFFIDAATTLLSVAFILFFIKGAEQKDEITIQTEEEILPKNQKSMISFLCKNPVIILFSFIMLIYNFCYIQWNYLLPLQTVEIFQERGGSFFSMLFSLNAITVIVFTPLLTSMTEKTGTFKSILIGGFLYFASFLLFSTNRLLLIIMIGVVIMTLGEILITINSNNYIAQKTPREFLGRVNSLLFIFMGIGFSAGPFVMGKIIANVTFPIAWFIVSAVMLFGIVFLFFINIMQKEK